MYALGPGSRALVPDGRALHVEYRAENYDEIDYV
jgi:hypothetical protein